MFYDVIGVIYMTSYLLFVIVVTLLRQSWINHLKRKSTFVLLYIRNTTQLRKPFRTAVLGRKADCYFQLFLIWKLIFDWYFQLFLIWKLICCIQLYLHGRMFLYLLRGLFSGLWPSFLLYKCRTSICWSCFRWDEDK